MSQSPFLHTPIVGNYRDFLVKPFIDVSLDDTQYTIPKKYEFRPDRLAYELYNDESLYFVFQLRNMDILKDPIFDFKTGVVIMIPTARSVENIRYGK